MRGEESLGRWQPALAALIGLVAAWAVQPACFGLPTQDRPDGGSPRATVCTPMANGELHWILLPLSAVVLAAILARLLRRVPFGEWWALGILVILATGAVITVESLDYVVPV
jgi:hypothetical protein